MLLLATSCGDTPSTSEDTTTESFVSEAVELDDLPEAEGRSVTAISDDRAIITGGVVGEPVDGASGWFNYTGVNDLWLLETSGDVTTLPGLPQEEGWISRIGSATEVGGTIVASVIECQEERSEFFGCHTRGEDRLWLHSHESGAWIPQDYPDEVLDGTDWPDEIHSVSGRTFHILGRSGSDVVMALESAEVVRFFSFNPTSRDFSIWSDTPIQGADSSTAGGTSYCLLNESSLVLMGNVEVDGSQNVGFRLEIFSREGRVQDGPIIRFDDLSSRLIHSGDIGIRCRRDGDAIASFNRGDGYSPIMSIDLDDLTVHDTFSDIIPDILSDPDTSSSFRNLTTSDQLVIRLSSVPDGHTERPGIYRLNMDGDLYLVEGLDHENLPFVIGNLVGTVDTRTGGVDVEQN